MGNVEAHDFAPVRADERKVLNLSRKVTPKQFVKVKQGIITLAQWNIFFAFLLQRIHCKEVFDAK